MEKLTILLLAVLTFSSCKNDKKETAPKEETETVLENETNDDWIVLFDGSSLDAWRGYLMDSVPSGWSIEENTLAFTPGNGEGQDIITKEKFENFELSMDWKISEAGNSGIFWGVLEDKNAKIYESALEVQVLDDERTHEPQDSGTRAPDSASVAAARRVTARANETLGAVHASVGAQTEHHFHQAL